GLASLRRVSGRVVRTKVDWIMPDIAEPAATAIGGRIADFSKFTFQPARQYGFGRSTWRFSREAVSMSGIRRLLLVGVAAAIGIFSVDRNCRPIMRMDPNYGWKEFSGSFGDPVEFADSPDDPIVPVEALDDVRKAERRRRAVRPVGDPERKNRLSYKQV